MLNHDMATFPSLSANRSMPDGTLFSGAPLVSVVICARNVASYLETQVDAITNGCEGHLSFEILIVDNASTDETGDVADAVARRDPRVRVVSATPAGLNLARNVGVRAAHGSLVAMCDADDVAETGWLCELVDAWKPGTYVGGALRIAGPNSERAQRRWRIVESDPEVPRYVIGGMETPAGGNCCFSREMWLDIGGFDAGLSGAGDETEFFVRAARAGYTYVTAPRAIVQYRLPESYMAVLTRAFRYGRHAARVKQQLGRPSTLDEQLKAAAGLVAQLSPVIIRRRGQYLWLHKLGRLLGDMTYRAQAG